MRPTKNQLLTGQIFQFDNEKWCIENENDDFRGAEVFFSSNQLSGWDRGFKIWFNGKLIHSSKTFESMDKRLQKLISDWNLEPTEQTELCSQ